MIITKTFTAIDFETAQGASHSICQTGIVRVVDGVITEQRSWITQPPGNYYWPHFTDIHGMSAVTTANSPTFDRIWPAIAPYLSGQHVVAHNGHGFDFRCIRSVLQYYELPPVEFTGHCTYKIFRRNLADLCRQFEIPRNHHDALSDAHACAQLFLIAQKNTELAQQNPEERVINGR